MGKDEETKTFLKEIGFGDLFESIKLSEKMCESLKKDAEDLDNVLLHNKPENEILKGEGWIIIIR